MNKKFLLPIFIMLGISLVAAITYYTVFSATFTVLPAITTEGDLEQKLNSTFDGETIPGEPITIINNAPSEREITLSDATECDITTSYVSELTLSQKIVDFGSEEPWVLTGDTANVRYTLVGDKFIAEITEGFIEGYVLVYYKDNSDRFNNPATAIGIDSVEGNLPYETDGNADEYDYCETGEYDTCHGAKIWYVNESAVDEGGNINWGMASDFLFETSLIQYNSEGEITIYPESSLTIIPTYKIGQYESGECTVTTTVA